MYDKLSAVILAFVIASSVVDFSLQIEPTYIDCANELNNALITISPPMAMVPPPPVLTNTTTLQPTILTAQFVVVELHGIETEEQKLSITAMFKLSWIDSRLAARKSGTFFGTICSSANYSHWTFVVEAMNRIPWYPQWVISNGGQNVMVHGAWDFYPAMIHGNGQVDWVSMYHLRTECIQDVFYFPADYQKCDVKISWPTTDAHVVQVKQPSEEAAVILHEATSAISSLWKLEGQKCEVLHSSTPSITFHLLLSRRSNFYIAAMMIPTLLINCMVMCGLLLPPLAPKKVVVAFLNLTTLFLTNIEYYEFLPKTSDESNSPVAMYFFACHNMFAAAATAFACFISRVGIFREKLEGERKMEDKRKYLEGMNQTRMEKVQEEIEAAEDKLVHGSILGSCARIKITVDKMNTIGCIVYGAMCIGSYIILLGFIYGRSATKMKDLLSSGGYQAVDVGIHSEHA